MLPVQNVLGVFLLERQFRLGIPDEWPSGKIDIYLTGLEADL